MEKNYLNILSLKLTTQILIIILNQLAKPSYGNPNSLVIAKNEIPKATPNNKEIIVLLLPLIFSP